MIVDRNTPSYICSAKCDKSRLVHGQALYVARTFAGAFDRGDGSSRGRKGVYDQLRRGRPAMDLFKGLSLEDFAGGTKILPPRSGKISGSFLVVQYCQNSAKHDAAALVHADLKDGAAGIKLLPAYIRCDLTDKGLAGVFREVERARARVLISLQTLRPPQRRRRGLPGRVGRHPGAIPVDQFCLDARRMY